MTETRKDLEKEAAAAGVADPENLPTATDVKVATDVAVGKQQQYFYPADGVTVVAKNREEADNKLKEALKAKD